MPLKRLLGNIREDLDQLDQFKKENFTAFFESVIEIFKFKIFYL